MNVDRDFSKLSESNNAPDVFLAYATDDQILMRQEQFPIVGLDSLKKYYEKWERKGNILTWEPLKADACGDLGYTFGRWKLKAKTNSGADTVLYGIYTTIWKKQADGSWKFVVDGGDETPSQFEFK
jgi:ketosteroid isomerase-like protein